MADYELIQSRIVSGKGVLKIPTDGVRGRSAILYAEVIRNPKNKYVNKGWNMERSRYANLVFLRAGYVMYALPMEFDKQVYDTINDSSGQTLIALKCAYEGILISFTNLATALGKVLTQYVDAIKEYQNLVYSWDEVRIVCYADTAIQFRLYGLSYDSCSLGKTQTNKPIVPPAGASPVAVGTPITVSPPYVASGSDGGATAPISTDLGTQVSTCNIIYDYTDLFNSAQSIPNRVSANFSAFKPITIGAVTYSNPSSMPSGSFLRSVVKITDAVGTVTNLQLVNNSQQGHIVTNLRTT